MSEAASEGLPNPYGYADMDWAQAMDPEYAHLRDLVRQHSVGEGGTLRSKSRKWWSLRSWPHVASSMGWRHICAVRCNTAPPNKSCSEAIKAAAVPGGGVAYSVGVRALQTLDTEGVFS